MAEGTVNTLAFTALCVALGIQPMDMDRLVMAMMITLIPPSPSELVERLVSEADALGIPHREYPPTIGDP